MVAELGKANVKRGVLAALAARATPTLKRKGSERRAI
jgi:hypothetical protein